MGLHSGGMILSRTPLYAFSPVQVSANGVRMVQFDKHDIEALGLVKFDVLGLRMLAALSFAENLILREENKRIDWTNIPLDDTATFNLIRSGRALGLFQIESQGQLHLLGQLQPECFDDLISEVAIFRPGPVQSGMVQPYVKRRRGREPISYLHPSLEPVLRDTYGVILFQEQVLQIAHAFAGMSMSQADNFRILMSKFRDAEEMESMRDVFVSGAVGKGVPDDLAHHVFNQVSKFVGYGFCRSHAAAFAKTVYQSAYLKTHHTAAFMAAVMEHRPGMYSLATLEQEARKFNIVIDLPDINVSGISYGIRKRDVQYSIVKPLSSIEHVSEDHARSIVWGRMNGPFTGISDFWSRVSVPKDVLFSLARSGAFDKLEKDSRSALWKAGVLNNQPRHTPPGLFESAAAEVPVYLLPELPDLGDAERIYWDLQTHRSGRNHPMTLVRDSLNQLEVRPISQAVSIPAAVRDKRNGFISVLAGIVILRQRPPTANGFMFVTLEDETGFVQIVVPPDLCDVFSHLLSTPALIVKGNVQYAGNWRGMVLQYAWRLDGIFGGYAGQASDSGGRDRWIKWAKDWKSDSERALMDYRKSA
jgi:error-prone DNA polymerase